MRVLLLIAAGCAGGPEGSVPLPDVDPFDACAPPGPITGEPCERGTDCMVICDCGVELGPVAAGTCLAGACERVRDVCDWACEDIEAVFEGRTCAVGDTGVWPEEFPYGP